VTSSEPVAHFRNFLLIISLFVLQHALDFIMIDVALLGGISSYRCEMSHDPLEQRFGSVAHVAFLWVLANEVIPTLVNTLSRVVGRGFVRHIFLSII
jgi:type IV secretory pathway TrbL component